MAQKSLVAVVGTGDDTQAAQPAINNARELGELLAKEGWAIVSGGRDAGIMKAVNEGAKKVVGSLTIGIISNKSSRIAQNIDVAIITDMNNARNNIIGLSSKVVIACGVDGAGTASEVALALKNKKKVILLGTNKATNDFFQKLDGKNVITAQTPEAAVQTIKDENLC
ncbi:hypothetical protein QTI66_39330 [Variovorax sp. J22R133]|uniref:SLOG cluster 4 domain-containing protein n=1 Tax=Variovorax brevis TaxID=3053503 RepID=UPI0025778ACE|nr:hypothetical protein [Variovorax sp. J22R133]MDM0118122.1 hypothetical protein [Variovorax sp. J22R133]